MILGNGRHDFSAIAIKGIKIFQLPQID